MRRFSSSSSIGFALVLVIDSVAAHRAAAQAPPEPRREAVPAPVESPFHPSLLVGVRLLAHEQMRIGELALRVQRGDVDAERKLYGELTDGLPDEVRDAVAAELPDLSSAGEILLTWKGAEAFQQVVDDAARRRSPLQVDDLLAVAWSNRLRDLPSEQDDAEVVAFAKKLEKLYGRPVPLRIWWANVGYLCFAALHTPSFWPADPEQRARAHAQAIEDLLSIATTTVDSDVARSVVDVALQPPLAGVGRRKAVTCARGSLEPFRGKVGFTRDHLDFVSKFDQEVAARRRADSATSPRESTAGRLAEFMADLKLRILREVDPTAAEKPSPLALKYGTIEESLAYYRHLLETLGVQAFWDEAKHDVERMLAGRFPSAFDAGIAALDEQLAAADLSAEQREQLARRRLELAMERDQELGALSRFVVSQFGVLAPLDQAVDEMHRLDGLATPIQREHLLDAWPALIQRDASWARRVADAHLHGPERYSDSAVNSACLTLSMHADDVECARQLADVAEHGAPGERSSALAMAKLWPEPLAHSLFESATADVEALLKRSPDVKAGQPLGDAMAYSSLLRGSVAVLYERRSEPWTRDALLATFDREGVNLWRGGSPFSPTVGRGNREVLDWIADTIDDASWKKLAEGGRIPDALMRVHEERRATK
jgi:hypothetical protein